MIMKQTGLSSEQARKILAFVDSEENMIPTARLLSDTHTIRTFIGGDNSNFSTLGLHSMGASIKFASIKDIKSQDNGASFDVTLEVIDGIKFQIGRDSGEYMAAVPESFFSAVRRILAPQEKLPTLQSEQG